MISRGAASLFRRIVTYVLTGMEIFLNFQNRQQHKYQADSLLERLLQCKFKVRKYHRSNYLIVMKANTSRPNVQTPLIGAMCSEVYN